MQKQRKPNFLGFPSLYLHLKVYQPECFQESGKALSDFSALDVKIKLFCPHAVFEEGDLLGHTSWSIPEALNSFR